MITASKDLGASFYVLQENDALLKQLIQSAYFDTEYVEIINQYFNNLHNFINDDINNEKRIKTIIEVLKKIWVKKHRKSITYLIFKDFNDFEKNLYQLSSYRDHFIHQFNVFLLGYYILNSLKKINNINEVFNKNSSEMNFTWMLASTFHDMGYPIEKMGELIRLYFDMFLKVETSFDINIENILTHNFYDYIQYLAEFHYVVDRLQENKWELYGDTKNKLDFQFQETLLNKLRKKDHGTISAILLLHSLLTKEKLVKNDDWLKKDLPCWIMPACHAISLHTFTYEEMQISFKKFPFAFLLSLCDELQDWGRSINEKDHSTLKGIYINENEDKPEIVIKIMCNNKKKYDNIKLLKKKLKCSLIKIKILVDNDQNKTIII